MEKLIVDSSEALQLPAQISINHCRAHTGQKEEVAKGQDCLARAAKAAGKTWQTPDTGAPLFTIRSFCSLKKKKSSTEGNGQMN